MSKLSRLIECNSSVNLSLDNLGLENIGQKKDDNIILSDIEVLK